ncbi:hypothetical protein Ahy_B06g084311 [Arachis hypogaea]|uniref:Uncharacterized protein n=1 Tax=Arachis hypogaea TaxID=3818 RepID=A0A444YRK3_ARAHY|nr:hypothetical protein Ahy_B06g084311 [Arachis hypogaea]
MAAQVARNSGGGKMNWTAVSVEISIAKCSAIPIGAGISDTFPELAEIFSIRIKHAPFLFEVLYIFRTNEHLVLILAGKVHRELRLPIIPENPPVTLEVPWLNALSILIKEPEQIDFDVSRAAGCPFVGCKPWQESIVEPQSITRVGVLVAVSRPSNFSNNYGQVSVPCFAESGNKGIKIRIEDIGVRCPVIVYGVGDTIKEGIIKREIVMPIETQERVNVHCKWCTILAEESYYLGH